MAVMVRSASRTGPAGPDLEQTSPVSTIRRQGPQRCLWCGREVAAGSSVGRRRRYCGQSCRQRAYENRSAMQRTGIPEDAVMLSADERDSLSDRLFQVRCAAEDVATALAERAGPDELSALVEVLLTAAREAEVLR